MFYLTFSSDLMGRQVCFVNWFCISSYLYVNTKKAIIIDSTYFYKNFSIFGPSNFFPVTRYFVTLFSNTPQKSWRNYVLFSLTQCRGGVIYVEYYKVNNKNTVKTDKTYINCLEDAFVRAKSMSYLSFFTELRRLTKTRTKLMPSINELSVSI